MKKVFLLLAIALPIVFNSCKDDKDEPIPDNHEYVDLGLPSGTLWATCNVGADSPEEYGDYFAWGETTPKDSYQWNNYKWSGLGSSNWLDALTKYWVDENGGILDGKRELEPEDDGVTVEAKLFSARRTDRAVLNRLRMEAGPAKEEPQEKSRAEPGLPAIGMDGKTKDGAMPYEILRNQLDFLK